MKLHLTESDFSQVPYFLFGSLCFLSLILFISSLLRPHRPNAQKLSTYECGEEAEGTAWTKFNIRFYVVALIFILFEVEVVFLLPWSTLIGHKTYFSSNSEGLKSLMVIEMLIFLGLLVLGLVYAWRKGYLDWITPKPKIEEIELPYSKDLYRKVNQKYKVHAKSF